MKRPNLTTVSNALRDCLIAAVVLTLVITVLVIASKQNSGRKTLDEVSTSVGNTNQILQYINDCTNPTGKCYKAGQANQAKVLGNVQLIIVLAAACAKQPENNTVTDIERCVQAGLGH